MQTMENSQRHDLETRRVKPECRKRAGRKRASDATKAQLIGRSYGDPWANGVTARELGAKREDNPYLRNTKNGKEDHALWDMGWEDIQSVGGNTGFRD